MQVTIVCSRCQNKSNMEFIAEFRYTELNFINAVSVLSVQCKKCSGYFMVSIPHENVFTKEVVKE